VKEPLSSASAAVYPKPSAREQQIWPLNELKNVSRSVSAKSRLIILTFSGTGTPERSNAEVVVIVSLG
jgi:hypothetical protein